MEDLSVFPQVGGHGNFEESNWKIALTVFSHLEDFQTIKCTGSDFELKILKVYISNLLPQPKENQLSVVYIEYMVINL